MARLQLGVLAAASLLGFRLVHLQLIRGSHYRQLAEANRLRLIPEQAPRGLIVDRRGRILATNQTLFRVALVPQELKDVNAVLAHVSTVVNRAPAALIETFKRERSLPFVPATILPRVPKDIALGLEEERWRLPGLLVRSETVRHYPRGSSAAHLLGYLGQPTQEELPLLRAYGIRPKQLIGRMGVERMMDQALRGRSGGLVVEVDSRGRQVRVLGRRAPQTGSTVTVTIDAELESLIEQVLGTQSGAGVVLDPLTGEVLAMVSQPAFNPEAFAIADAASVSQWLEDPKAPLMNRATMGAYQPGSVMKLISAGAALEHGIISPATRLVCAGSLKIGDRVIHCWNRDGHGSVTLPEALMQSCNVYFMRVGMKLGAGGLLEGMRAMGLSQRTGWPLDEGRGHLPQRRLTTGEVAMLAIGQGEVLMTVLQAAMMAEALANGGWLIEPWVVRAIDGRVIDRKVARHSLGWSTRTIEAVREGMKAVVGDPAGTGHRAFTPLVTIAGKTGTAQTHVPGHPHGWFVGFCPVDQPRVAIAIVAEHGGSGGDLPAEIARTICEYVSAPETL